MVPTTGGCRAGARTFAAAIVAALVAMATSPVAPAAPPAPRVVAVVVQAVGATAPVRAAVEEAGGSVGVDLPIVAGFAATLPASQVDTIRSRPDVRAVTPDERVHVAASAGDDADADADEALTSVFADEIGARALWDEGVAGAGVTVALVDTGVSRVDDIASRLVRVADPFDRRKTVDCVNFSGEATCGDSYGHGTFVAGLIAGTGARSGGTFTGVAPGASIVSIKIAGRDGSADVSKILAAIQWVVSFRSQYGIRVLNLSLGTDSTADYRHDPLNVAVERAWSSGVTVVIAAGNRGPAPRTISKPADDPLVVTVGAVDDRETPDIADDMLPSFSSRGPTAQGLAKPDVVAPGGRVVSLQAPGSLIATTLPGPDESYRRGSGTSMAAAIVAGVVALVQHAHPDWRPDRIKFALMATARDVASDDVNGVGAGIVSAVDAVHDAPAGEANRRRATLSDGTASLDSSRRNVTVTRGCSATDPPARRGCKQAGQVTAQQRTWDPREFVKVGWDPTSWYKSQWTRARTDGSSWYGSSWYGNNWKSGDWAGSSRYGTVDQSIDYGTTITGSSWYGAWG